MENSIFGKKYDFNRIIGVNESVSENEDTANIAIACGGVSLHIPSDNNIVSSAEEGEINTETVILSNIIHTAVHGDSGEGNLEVGGEDTVTDEDDEDDGFDGFDFAPVVRNTDEADYGGSYPERPKISDAIRDLGIRLNSRRRVTFNARIQGLTSAYLDQDDSGTWDPKHNRVTPSPSPPTRRTRTASTRSSGRNDEGNSKGKTAANGWSHIIMLAFKETASLEYLRSITPGPYDFDSSGASGDNKDSTLGSADLDDVGVSLANKRKARKSISKTKISQRDDGLTLDFLTNDHPQRHGCKACFHLGNDECSLVNDPHTHPCVNCDDAGNDCELIISPVLKKRCDQCKRKRHACSYSVDGGRGVQSCEECEKLDTPCITAPGQAKLYTKHEITSGRNFSKSEAKEDDAGPSRQYVSCNRCRTGSLRCNLKRGEDGPCRSCHKAGDTCKFVVKGQEIHNPILSIKNSKNIRLPKGLLLNERPSTPPPFNLEEHEKGKPNTPNENFRLLYYEAALHKGTRRNKRIGRKRANAPSLQDSRNQHDPNAAVLIGRTAGIQHIFIDTAFCHPIRFNYIPDDEAQFPCSWCSSSVFGLWGHGLKTDVEVIPYGGQDGNEEVAGGHADDGNISSTMCVSCTTERISIMMCENHDLGPLEKKEIIEIRVIEENFKRMAAGDKKSERTIRQVKWCSICVAPAIARCSAWSGMQTCHGYDDGCGLLLCIACLDIMERIRRSLDPRITFDIIEQHIKVWKNEFWKRDDGDQLRADVEFLVQIGELKKRSDQGMGMCTHEQASFKVSAVGTAGESL